MYVTTRGMRGYRRGLGDTVVTDPVTGEQRVVTSQPITTETVYASGAPSVYTGAQAIQPTTFTGWLNTNATMVAIGAAAFVGLLLFAKAGR